MPDLCEGLDGTLGLGVVALEAPPGCVPLVLSGFALAPWRGVTRMLITDALFQAFLQCETKSHLKLSGAVGDQQEFSEWERHRVEAYKRQCHRQLRSVFREAECLVDVAFPPDLEDSRYRLVMDCRVRAQEIQSHIHALERVASPGQTSHNPYIPIRCVPREKITKQDKLLLAFDALALWTASGQVPLFGKILHGSKQMAVKVHLTALMEVAKSVVGKIAVQQAGSMPPRLVLNKHCAECEFKARCRHSAVEKDELSLLSGMTAQEIKKQQHKGIFSVTQLSYTFRPRNSTGVLGE